MMAGKTVPPVERRWFLSYNSADRELIRGVDRYLATHGIPTFIDRTSLVAGSPWFDEVERALVDAPGVLVFLGPSGLGSVQKRELQFALVRQAQVESAGGSSFRVIPVLFPRFDRRQLPGFAALNTWIEVANPPDAPELLSALGAAHASTGPDIVEPRTRVCPFRALNAFREEDASLYFGRDKEAGKLLDLVRGHPLVAVVGPSGSGKSSLVLSGLLPRLRIERPPRTAWEIIVFNPAKRPYYNLASALVRLWRSDGRDVSEVVAEAEKIERRLVEKEGHLVNYIHEAVKHLQHADRLLIVIDQFEELFTDSENASVRQHFLDSLLAAISEEPCQVVITLRADYYGRAIELSRTLSAHLERAQLNVGPMMRAELRDVIVGPSVKARLTFEDGLVDRILDEVEQQPGSLPLLEFALTELWARSPDGRFTHRQYEVVGKVSGAISARAEQVLTRLADPQLQTARSVLTRLVRVSSAEEEGAHSRAMLRLADLDADGIATLEEFVKARLVGFDRETDREATAQVAHEALIRNWGTLRGWIDRDLRFYVWRQRLDVFVSEWKRTNGDASTLLTGVLLEDAREWSRTHSQQLSPVQREFIDAARRRQSGSKMLRRFAAAAAVTAATLVGAWVWWTRSDAYQIRSAIAKAPVRVAEFSSRSDDDPWLETIQAWLATLVRTGRESTAVAAIGQGLMGGCSSATLATERRALRGPDEDVLPEVQGLIVERSSDAWRCLGQLSLSERERTIAAEAARKLRVDDRLNQHDRYRSPIEAARLLILLGDRPAAHEQVSHVLSAVARETVDARTATFAMLARRVGVALLPEERIRLLRQDEPDSFNSQRIHAALTLPEVTISGIDAYLKGVGVGGILAVYDEFHAAAIGEVFARAIHEGHVQEALEALERTIKPLYIQPTEDECLPRSSIPSAVSLPRQGGSMRPLATLNVRS